VRERERERERERGALHVTSSRCVFLGNFVSFERKGVGQRYLVNKD
jgi:hypothetical protein